MRWKQAAIAEQGFWWKPGVSLLLGVLRAQLAPTGQLGGEWLAESR